MTVTRQELIDAIQDYGSRMWTLAGAYRDGDDATIKRAQRQHEAAFVRVANLIDAAVPR